MVALSLEIHPYLKSWAADCHSSISRVAKHYSVALDSSPEPKGEFELAALMPTRMDTMILLCSMFRYPGESCILTT